ncbi:MAG: hypothetical protein ACREQ5_37205 [Candidatus Dormibacteria bacterium]
MTGFYVNGELAEAVRISTAIRVLVHESGSSKPLLKQLQSNYLEIPIPDSKPANVDLRLSVFFLGIGVRMGPGATVSPFSDLSAPFYRPGPLGDWWRKVVMVFPKGGRRMEYTRKKIILILANQEGGAHVDPEADPDYVHLITDAPFKVTFNGIESETPNFARYVAGQCGAEMLECLHQNFFPGMGIPKKWAAPAKEEPSASGA